jgi:hypothetical protein
METRKQKGNIYTIQYNSAGSLHAGIQDAKRTVEVASIFLMLQTKQLTASTG